MTSPWSQLRRRWQHSACSSGGRHAQPHRRLAFDQDGEEGLDLAVGPLLEQCHHVLVHALHRKIRYAAVHAFLDLGKDLG